MLLVNAICKKQDANILCFLCDRDVRSSLYLCADGWYKIEQNRVGTGWTELVFNPETHSYRPGQPVVLPKGELAPSVCTDCYERNTRKQRMGGRNSKGANDAEKLRITKGGLADYRGR